MEQQKQSARGVAAQILTAISEKGAYSNLMLDEALGRANLSVQDAAFTSALVYGVLERRLTLDYLLSQHSSRELDTLAPAVRELLRMGAYQLLYMNGVPSSAAVNESVRLTRTFTQPGAAGYVNAVLRSLSRAGKTPDLPDREKRFESYLSVAGSCSKWMVKLLVRQYGRETAERILLGSLGRPPVYVRVNEHKLTEDELLHKLHTRGIQAVSTGVQGCVLLPAGVGAPERLEEIQRGECHVQDMASQLCTLALEAAPGMRVLDTCAAPGGKSLSIASRMGDEGEIVSCDLHAHRVGLISQAAARLGFTCIRPLAHDATLPLEEGRFDRVLCDVPCSGLGVIRRKPEIKYKSRDFLEGLPPVQYKILEMSAHYCKVGGILLYSTCTLNRQENEEVVERFLEKNKNFEIEKLPKVLYDYGQGNSWATLLPSPDGPDGFFVCRMRCTGE